MAWGIGEGIDPAMEAEAKAWIEAVLGEGVLEGDSLQEALKSGVVLVNLINAIKPGTCKPPQNKKLPFVQRENIASYLAGCTALGIPGFQTFQTIDLFEDKNMKAVIINIHALGSTAQKLGFDGPVLGAKMATANKREFTEEQLNAGKGAVPVFGKGSHVSAQEDAKSKLGVGVQPPSSLVRQNSALAAKISAKLSGDTSSRPRAATAAVDSSHGAVEATPPLEPAVTGAQTAAAPASDMPTPLPSVAPEVAAESTPATAPIPADAVAAPTPPPPAPEVAAEEAAATPAEEAAATPAEEAAATPAEEVAATPAEEVAATPAEEAAATPAEEAAAAGSPEQQAKAWIEAVLGEGVLEGDSLQEALKSGVVLVNLINAIKPGTCKPPQNKKLPFVQRENIASYLAGCTALGIPGFQTFQTIDLFEDKNMKAVIINIHALGSTAQKLGFDGPVLGAKMATANKVCACALPLVCTCLCTRVFASSPAAPSPRLAHASLTPAVPLVVPALLASANGLRTRCVRVGTSSI